MKAHRYEFRLLWRYKGRAKSVSMLAQQSTAILRHLRRIGTDKPWEGATIATIRKSWLRLSLMLEVPFETIADLKAREVIARIQAAYPELEFIRVEHRQVGEWVETMDPLKHLCSPKTPMHDAKLEALYTKLDGMTRAELDVWRALPSTADKVRHSYAKHDRDRRLGGLKSRQQGDAAATAAPGAPRRTDGAR